MAGIKAVLGVMRAPFLLLPVTLVAAGSASAAFDGTFSWSHTAIALFGLLALHIAVNSLNEASDMRTGIDLNTERTPFSGGSGTLPAGQMTERGTRAIAYLALLCGLSCGCYFFYLYGWILLPLFIVGAVCAMSYSNLLARRGLGETAAGLGLGALPVIGSAMVQDGTLGTTAIVISVPAFLMTFNLLLLNEFPDESADRTGGRRNLVLILGRKAGARLYALAALLTPAVIAAAVFAEALPQFCLFALLPSLLLVPPLRWTFGDPDRAVPVPALGANVIWNLLTNSTLAVTLTIAEFS